MDVRYGQQIHKEEPMNLTVLIEVAFGVEDDQKAATEYFNKLQSYRRIYPYRWVGLLSFRCG
jgi:hypothetical protein